MILQLNHLHGKLAGASAQDVVSVVYSLREEGHLDDAQFANLRVHLDWVQYKQNFREVVTVTQCLDERGEAAPLIEIHVDTRQLPPASLRKEMICDIATSIP